MSVSRTACAKCSFYRPKGSSQTQLLEAKANLLRLKEDIPLTDDDRAAVDDGLEALEKLCAQLVDVPTPAGATPRELLGPGQGAQRVVGAPGRARSSAGRTSADRSASPT